MTFDKVQELVDHTYEKTKYETGDFRDCEVRASDFIAMNAVLITHKYDLRSEVVTLTSLRDAIFKQALLTADASNVTTKKVIAEANGDYQKIRERLELTENKIEYVRHFIDLFKDAHIFYRQLSKGD